MQVLASGHWLKKLYLTGEGEAVRQGEGTGHWLKKLYLTGEGEAVRQGEGAGHWLKKLYLTEEGGGRLDRVKVLDTG